MATKSCSPACCRQVTLFCLHFSDIDVDIANGIFLELLLHQLLPFDLGQAADLPAAGRCHDVAGNDAGKSVSDVGSWLAGHTGNRPGATRCVCDLPAAGRNATTIASSASDKLVERGCFGPIFASWTKSRRFHFATVFGFRPACCRQVIALRQFGYALLTILYCSTHHLSRCGAAV